MELPLEIKPTNAYAALRPFAVLFTAIVVLLIFLYAGTLVSHHYLNIASYAVPSAIYLFYIYRFLFIKSITYIITKDQIKYKRGVFSIIIDNLEVYRIKDYAVKRTFLMRFINAMSLMMETSDKSHPVFVMEGIHKSAFDQNISPFIESARKRNNVYEID